MPFVEINRHEFGRIEHYAKIAGVTTEAAIKTAIKEWMDGTGDAIIKEVELRVQSPGHEPVHREKAHGISIVEPSPSSSHPSRKPR